MPVVKLEGGGYAIVCTRGQKPKGCQWCGQESHFLCDYQTAPGKTCDKRMCLKHSTRVAHGTDHCPDHAQEATQV